LSANYEYQNPDEYVQDIDDTEVGLLASHRERRWWHGCVLLTTLLLFLLLCSTVFILAGIEMKQLIDLRLSASAPTDMPPAQVVADTTPSPSPTPFLPTDVPRPLILILTPTGALVPISANQALILDAPPPASPTPVPPVPTPPTPEPPTDPGLKPRAEVTNGTLELRSGPGLHFPSVATWGVGIPLNVRSQTLDGLWIQVCCIQTLSEPEGALWVARHSKELKIVGEANLQLYATPISLPTPAIVLSPFERVRGPEFYQTDQNIISIEAKVFVGDEPLAGYLLAVEFSPVSGGGVEKRLNQDQQLLSRDQFSIGFTGDQFNYKYEFRGELGIGTWRVWLTNSEGYNLWLNDDPAYKLHQLSDNIIFTSDPSNKDRQIYLAWIRTR
jgi:hypothetical protein